jgi:hypothetical protein
VLFAGAPLLRPERHAAGYKARIVAMEGFINLRLRPYCGADHGLIAIVPAVIVIALYGTRRGP